MQFFYQIFVDVLAIIRVGGHCKRKLLVLFADWSPEQHVYLQFIA